MNPSVYYGLPQKVNRQDSSVPFKNGHYLLQAISNDRINTLFTSYYWLPQNIKLWRLVSPISWESQNKKTDRILHWLRDICGQPQDNKLWLFFSAYQGQSNENKEITHEIWNGIVETNFMKQKRDCLGIIQVVQKNFLKIHLYFL